jgi:hypothetical protein
MVRVPGHVQRAHAACSAWWGKAFHEIRLMGVVLVVGMPRHGDAAHCTLQHLLRTQMQPLNTSLCMMGLHCCSGPTVILCSNFTSNSSA